MIIRKGALRVEIEPAEGLARDRFEITLHLPQGEGWPEKVVHPVDTATWTPEADARAFLLQLAADALALAEAVLTAPVGS